MINTCGSAGAQPQTNVFPPNGSGPQGHNDAVILLVMCFAPGNKHLDRFPLLCGCLFGVAFGEVFFCILAHIFDENIEVMLLRPYEKCCLSIPYNVVIS